PQRMREVDLTVNLDRFVFTQTDRRCRPFPDPIHGEDCGCLERRGIKGACSVCLMVFGKYQLVADVESGHAASQFVAQHFALEQLLPRPYWNRRGERSESSRCNGEIRL